MPGSAMRQRYSHAPGDNDGRRNETDRVFRRKSPTIRWTRPWRAEARRSAPNSGAGLKPCNLDPKRAAEVANLEQ